VIIDRQVNAGETVVSSLSAPSLFIIASDLTHIQVWVSVNEADIGGISEDEPVTFTVDAYPGQVFHGHVGQVRLNATMIQNVVTYTVEVDTDNSDGKLMPYLTANAQFQIGRRHDVLVVPAAALHWSPQPNQIAPDSREGSAGDHGGGTIWIEQGTFVRPLHVSTGLTDGASTEVEGQGVTEGLRVVVGEGTPGGAKLPRVPSRLKSFAGSVRAKARPLQLPAVSPLNRVAKVVDFIGTTSTWPTTSVRSRP
jgi:HlyD family secretion protein